MLRLLLLFLITTTLANAQTPQRIDSIPETGRELKQGWRWHVGDNPAWASANFDDSRWDTVGTPITIPKLPQMDHQQIGWFRTTFVLDSAVTTLPLALRIWHSGAAEIYLDGKLFHRSGQISPKGELVEGYSSPTAEYHWVSQLTPGQHVLAVRLVHFMPHWYEPVVGSRKWAMLSVSFLNLDGKAKSEVEKTFWDTLQSYLLGGFFIALSAIHALYFLYRRKRINAVFSITMLLFAIISITGDIAGRTTSPRLTEWAFFLKQLVQVLFYSLLFLTYSLYLQRRPSILYYLTAGLAFLSILLNAYVDIDWLNDVSNYSLLFLLILGIWLSITAVRNRIPNAWIAFLSIGLLGAIVLVQAILSELLDVQTWDQYPFLSTIFNILFFISIPFTLALMLARENAHTNDQLAHQLEEVERLSAEKEHLLREQNATLEQQVTARTAELRQSLEDLRNTQQQLVQREKMASLGELTAGIAHEIQNPLNFVNNFSEVSTELINEIRDERQQPDEKRDEPLIDEILGDVEQNLQKIAHHGKRAASIVRGMLEHSRTSTGQREPTDLNALADEYLRLSYHGLRAKQKDFNAKLITDFDPTLPPVTVAGQDLGRVLLNLFTNAFHAVNERQQKEQAGYDPTVSVSIKKVAEGVDIRVSDNGTGIPEIIRQKIFQPFFTTKPTGQGTGLGLSLSYDIVTKGHNGTLTVESEEGQGTTFVITLPV